MPSLKNPPHPPSHKIALNALGALIPTLLKNGMAIIPTAHSAENLLPGILPW